MTWKVRHQGSPQSVEGLTLAQVVEGLQDGLWEPTDEVMGPQDKDWVAIENHPQLAEVAMAVEVVVGREPVEEVLGAVDAALAAGIPGVRARVMSLGGGVVVWGTKGPVQ